MGKIFKALVAALTVGSALAVSAPAQARHDGWDGGWRGDRGWHGDHGWGDRGGGWDRGWHGDHWRGGWDGYYGPRRYYGPRYGYYERDDGDAALAAIAGIAIGAAIVSSH